MVASIAHAASAVAMPQPREPCDGTPRPPSVNSQLPARLVASPTAAVYITGRVQPMPSLV